MVFYHLEKKSINDQIFIYIDNNISYFGFKSEFNVPNNWGKRPGVELDDVKSRKTSKESTGNQIYT